ncbi:MAG: glutamate racemase [Clostridia bacterium]|nr:glutamate racemase [Clostridia bacterium]
MRIGFFDSGIGGLTVLKEALRQLPNEDYIYYADTSHVPYGTKTKEEVRTYIFEAVDFIAEHSVDALVIACNTATSIAVKDLRQRYSFPIVGMEPAVKPAVERCKEKRVLVTATPLTLKEEKFQNLVSRVDVENIVDILPLPELVDFAERFVFDEEIVIPYLKDKLGGFDLKQYGTIVLGCTHFPFFKGYIRKVAGDGIDTIDGNEGTIKRLKSLLTERGGDFSSKKNGTIEYYSSGVRMMETYRFSKYFGIIEQEIK